MGGFSNSEIASSNRSKGEHVFLHSERVVGPWNSQGPRDDGQQTGSRLRFQQLSRKR